MLFKRSLLQELVTTAIGGFLVLFGIVIAQRVAYYIGVAAKGSLASDAINTLLGFSMLKFLPMMLSLTLFLAVLLTLSRWHRDSEMVVWFSAGQGLSSWIRPVLTFGLPVIVVIALLSLFVTPWATGKGAEFRDQLKSRDELASISPGVFKESRHADRVFFVESFDELGNIVKNIFVQSMQHQKLGIIVAARGHRETAENGDDFLVMQNGRRYEGTPNTAEYSITEFERYAIRIEPAEVQQQPPNTQSKNSLELFNEHSPDSIAELQWRLAIPISAFVLILLAIPLSFVDPRSGRSANLMMALLIYIVYNNLLSIMQAWLSQGKVPAMVGLWPVHAFFLLLTFWMFYRRLFQLPFLPRLWRK
ncbi:MULTISPECIES: LPS export ABC transporter permease LptF [Methylobacillus]|uniref:Lipopolysaccharide export system permease protein LptF n=1 Tax=Methylobacillus flagellatus (strain ATCC 51484 / DSM 6875 / VKM B-1610 / KT) TaxID=265072 RepID=Q1H4U5_METFK|nr:MULTISPECIES: LPS export ABC transporter permease LptF [Methylobacillus]ABE48492.1 permease YjgP/YjgQ [Methylobacillus flagellatus KT]MPS48285.1 LPS export ABC transporter permease LptF [Methylobacillus sp.]